MWGEERGEREEGERRERGRREHQHTVTGREPGSEVAAMTSLWMIY